MKRKHFDTHEGNDEMILRPMSELPHFTQLAVMADGAGCIGQCSRLREKGDSGPTSPNEEQFTGIGIICNGNSFTPVKKSKIYPFFATSAMG